MPTGEAVIAIILLLPGFVTAAVFDAISIRRKRTPFETLCEVILFEVLVVTTYALLSRAWTSIRFTTQSLEGDLALDGNAPALCVVALIAVAWGLLLGTVHNRDWLFSWLRQHGVTRQSSHARVWSGAFYNLDSWVVVHLANGTRIIGWPAHFSDDADESSAFLTHAAYLGDDGSVVEIPGPGILVTKEAGIRLVEFVGASALSALSNQQRVHEWLK